MKKLLLLITVFIAGLKLDAQYCNSIADSTNTHDITQVILNGSGTTGNLNNSTSCGSLVGSQGTASGLADRYSNFTTSTSTPIPNLQRGNSYTLNVKTNACGGNIGGIRMAFADWNNDGDFLDSMEKIIIDNTFSTDSMKSATFFVPFGSYTGLTRLRIVYRFATSISIINSCTITSGSNIGETEDYLVTLSNCTNLFVNSFINGNIGSTVGFTSTGTGGYSSIQWYKNNVLINGATSSTFVIANSQPSDTGEYCVNYTYPNGCVISNCVWLRNCTPTYSTRTDSLVLEVHIISMEMHIRHLERM